MHPVLPLALLPLALVGAGPATSETVRVYVGTYAREDAQGIYLLSFNTASGALESLGRAFDMPTPSFLAQHPTLPVLYAVGEAVQPEGTVAALRMGEDGMLSLLNEQPSAGRNPCHLAVAPSGKHVAVANYSSGTVSVFPVEADGRLGEACCVVKHEGSGPNAARQEAPHAHSVNFDGAGRFLYAADLGIDEVRIYRCDGETGVLTPADPAMLKLPPGSGPRHLSWSPEGFNAWVLNELTGTVTTCAHDPETGSLRIIETVSGLPADFAGDNLSAEVRVHPSGRFVYTSNRGHDSIARFWPDRATGRLKPQGHTPSGGRTPRNFAIDPTGQWMLVANQESDNVVVFRIDQAYGFLEPRGKVVGVPSGACLLFSR